MNKFLILLFLSISSLSFSQGLSEKSDLWNRGDILVGVNSDLLGQSWTDVSLSPSLGYAITDDDLVYANFSYTDNPSRSAYRLGYNHQVCSLAYVGVAGSISKYQSEEWAKYFCIEAGIGKTLGDWLLITTKVAFGHLWDNNITQFTLNTTVTFSIKI